MAEAVASPQRVRRSIETAANRPALTRTVLTMCPQVRGHIPLLTGNNGHTGAEFEMYYDI